MSDLLEGARNELVPQSLEAASDAAVDQAVADPHDEAAQQAGIDLDVELDATAGELLESRSVRARTSSAVSGAALVAVATVMPWRALSRRRNSAATLRQLLDPAAPEHQPDEVERPGARRSCRRLDSTIAVARLERDGRVGEHAPDRLVRDDRARPSSSSARHGSTVPSRRATSKAASA